MANDDYNNVDEDDDEWEHSDAKKLLKGDLLSGKIPLDGEGMTPQEAYLQRPEFIASDPKYKRFPNRLRALREQLIAKNDRADEDREALLHDRKLHPIPERNHRGELRWEGSEVQRLLRLDMDSGKHKTMKPSVSWFLSWFQHIRHKKSLKKRKTSSKKRKTSFRQFCRVHLCC
jgi:hypothetical protein